MTIEFKKGFEVVDAINDNPAVFEASNGNEYKIPISYNSYLHIPIKPSECNKWIEYFINLRDNFTDDEIDEFNNKMMRKALGSDYVDMMEYETKGLKEKRKSNL